LRPEYEKCKEVAKKNRVSLQAIYREIERVQSSHT
jgi:uncharacterized protein (DUF111 family)